jgi:hypothetical protein
VECLLYREVDHNGNPGAYVLREILPEKCKEFSLPEGNKSLWEEVKELVQRPNLWALDEFKQRLMVGSEASGGPEEFLCLKGDTLEQLAEEFRKKSTSKDYQITPLDQQTIFFSDIDVYEATGIPVSETEKKTFDELLAQAV